MKFQELDKRKTSEVEATLTEKFLKEDLLEKTIQNRCDCENFVFYDGPATANGMPGIHHMLSKLLKDMVEYLKNSQDDEFAQKYGIRPGVGLAAPQIGYDKRFFAVYLIDDDGNELKYGLVNPRIIMSSVKKCALRSGEGCLSVKNDKKGYVYRYHKITLRAYDVFEEKEIEIKAKGFTAIVLQHELDHLDGIVYYDRISKNSPYQEIENSVFI